MTAGRLASLLACHCLTLGGDRVALLAVAVTWRGRWTHRALTSLATSYPSYPMVLQATFCGHIEMEIFKVYHVEVT